MWTWLKDKHQNLSWKLGYQRAFHGEPFDPPWWVDKMLFALGDIEGKNELMLRKAKPR